MRTPVVVSVLALSLLASSCASPRSASPMDAPNLAVSPVAPSIEPGLLAGAAKVDITPMPGIPLGGHSIEGGIGYGVWTRLWARAVYVEDPSGEPLVLVAADLWSIPAGLVDAVVERVQTHHGLTEIGRAQVLIAATHTHHSPANYSSSRLYNRAASTMMGFDPELHTFLVHKIAQAIATAASSKTPARLALSSAPVAGVARNRSTAPFAHNPEAAGILAANAALPSCPSAPADADAPGVDPCQAIDPTLTILRVDALDGRPLAVAAFFAVHATSMVNATDAYNGDLFAVATARAEAALARSHGALGDPVVALFNGPEGDISPHWERQGRADALTIGARLGDAIVATAGLAGLASDGDEPCHAARGRAIDGAIESRFTRVPLAEQPVAGPPSASTAARALPGKSILGGAEDGRTRFFDRLPEGQTVERSRRAGQGAKRPAVAPGFYAMIFPKPTIPSEAPLSIHQIGPLTIAALPGEFSTVLGMRIRAALREQLPDDAARPVLVGLAGEYLSYFVTPQEYALQHYEGASTFWGQYAGSFLAERITALASGAPPAELPAAEHHPGLARRFALTGARAHRRLRALDHRLAEQLAIAGFDRAPRLEFESNAPSWTTLIWPTLQVEIRDAEGRWRPFVRDGAVVDERGTELLMFPVAIERERWRFAVVWMAATELDPHASFRLHGFGPDGAEHCSAAFAGGAAPSPTAVACVARTPAAIDPREGLGLVPGP